MASTMLYFISSGNGFYVFILSTKNTENPTVNALNTVKIKKSKR